MNPEPDPAPGPAPDPAPESTWRTRRRQWKARLMTRSVALVGIGVVVGGLLAGAATALAVRDDSSPGRSVEGRDGGGDHRGDHRGDHGDGHRSNGDRNDD